MKFIKKILTLVLAAMMTISMFVVTAAAPARFTDVPTSHWAYADIEALAEGGLVNGMGDGTFAPDSQLTIAQMATILANAMGLQTGEGDGKWYYKAVKAAVDGGYLPNLSSNITDGTYEAACTRELAIYMVLEGLGVKDGMKVNGKKAEDIPDYGMVTRDYRTDVLKAVQYGIINGIDEAGNFAPQNILTRAQICAILNRAGYTTAKPKAQALADGMENAEIYEAITTTGLFEEKIGSDLAERAIKDLVAKERKYAKLTVRYNVDTGSLKIMANEYDSKLVFSEDYKYILDEQGNKVTDEFDFYDDNGKFVSVSGLSYSSRQLLKQVLQITFPSEYEQAIAGLMECLVPPYSYTGKSSYPSKLLWLNGRCVMVYGDKGYQIDISRLNDTGLYERLASSPSTPTPMTYRDGAPGDGYPGGVVDLRVAYELDRW